jgi:predicted DsbA family dithiol-disulfide isomerase
MKKPLEIDVYFDYICPWCYVASFRLLMLKEECGEKISIQWKSFPLDPHGWRPKYPVPLLNQSRLRAGREEEKAVIEPWPEDKPLPASSMPAHEAARCAQLQGAEAFQGYHMALMQAYFSHCQDISDRQVLISLAEDIHLDIKKFIADLDSEIPRARVLAEYEEAVTDGNIVGVPTVIIGQRAVLEAAVPLELYRHAVQRLSQ